MKKKKANAVYYCSFRAWDAVNNRYSDFTGICGINSADIHHLKDEEIVWLVSAETGKKYKLSDVTDFSIRK